MLSTLCRHIGLLFGERLDTLFTSSDLKISGFTRPHVIGFVADLFFFPLWRADLFFSGFAVEFAGCVWTVAVSGKKKLRIRKYPDTCGRGLNPCADADAMFYSCESHFREKKIRFFPMRNFRFLHEPGIRQCYNILLSIFSYIICQVVTYGPGGLIVVAVAYERWSLTRGFKYSDLRLGSNAVLHMSRIECK